MRRKREGDSILLLYRRNAQENICVLTNKRYKRKYSTQQKQVSGRSFIDRPETCSTTVTGDHGEGRE